MNTGRISTIPWRRALSALSLSLWLLSCQDSPLLVAPLGAHEVPAGRAWSLSLTAAGAAPDGVTWKLLSGPAAMTVAQSGTHAELRWTPTSFDLAPLPPGKPRQAGPWQDVQVQAIDHSGAQATATGRVRAVPVELDGAVTAPHTVAIHLDASAAVRFSVAHPLVSAGLATWQLQPPQGVVCEMLTVGQPQDLVRCRAEDMAIAASDRAIVPIIVVQGGAPSGRADVLVRWDGRAEWTPCQGAGPTLRANLAAQVLAAQGTVSSADAWSIDTGLGAVANAGAALPLPIAAQGLTPLSVSALGSGDPMLAACAGATRWPQHGLALGAAGPGCTDDAAPGPTALQWPISVDRRLCPGTTDHLQLAAPTGAGGDAVGSAPQWLRAQVETPDGWPPATAWIEDQHGAGCAFKPGRPCTLPTTGGPWTVDVTADAPTSAHLRFSPASQACTVAPAGKPAGLAIGSDASYALCGGETVGLFAVTDQRVTARAAPGSASMRWQGQDGAWHWANPTGDGGWADVPANAAIELGAAVSEPAVLAVWAEQVPPGAPPVRLQPASFAVAAAPGPAILGWVLQDGDSVAVTLPQPGTAATWMPDPPWIPAETAKVSGVLASGAVVLSGPGQFGWRTMTGAPTALWNPSGSCTDRSSGAAPLTIPRTQTRWVPALRVCPGAAAVVQVQVQRDDLLEVGAAADVPLDLRVFDSAGSVCAQGTATLQVAPPGLQPPHLTTARCWVRATGVASVRVTAEKSARWDLAVRRR